MGAPVKFGKAQKKKSKLRLAFIGPAGSGKTRSALEVAAGLGTKIAVLDTERGSASLYSDHVAFDVCELESFSPGAYVEAIQAAEAAGYEVIVIDSLSHAWSGKDGALEQVDKAAKRSGSGNSFNAWREVTPQHNTMVDAILRCRAHVIVTMRTKTEYVVEKDERTGRSAPRKIGLAPVQRDGLDYEFTVVGDIDLEHTLTITKTRCEALDGAVIVKPGLAMAATLLAWLDSGAAEVQQPAQDVSSASEPAARPTHIAEAAQVAPPAPVVQASGSGDEVGDLRAAIAAAGDLSALALLVPRLASLPGKDKDAMRQVYSARQVFLMKEPAQASQ
jgi:hypothetical protein